MQFRPPPPRSRQSSTASRRGRRGLRAPQLSLADLLHAAWALAVFDCRDDAALAGVLQWLMVLADVAGGGAICTALHRAPKNR